MKSIKKGIFAGFTLVGLFYFLLFLPAIHAEEPTGESREIDILTTPEKVLFDISNMKPGDWSVRTIEIKNGGNADLNYVVSGKRKSGSKDLYNELLLTIKDDNGELYNGKMNEFDKLENRQLASGESETLEFTVKFSEEAGNLLQGKSTEVQLKFYAEGTLGGVLPIDGPKIPATATEFYQLLLSGMVLLGGGTLLFYIRKKMKKASLG